MGALHGQMELWQVTNVREFKTKRATAWSHTERNLVTVQGAVLNQELPARIRNCRVGGLCAFCL